MKEQIISDFIKKISLENLNEVFEDGTSASDQYKKVEELKSKLIHDTELFLRLDSEINSLINIVALEMFKNGMEFGVNLKNEILK